MAPRRVSAQSAEPEIARTDYPLSHTEVSSNTSQDHGQDLRLPGGSMGGSSNLLTSPPSAAAPMLLK